MYTDCVWPIKKSAEFITIRFCFIFADRIPAARTRETFIITTPANHTATMTVVKEFMHSEKDAKADEIVVVAEKPEGKFTNHTCLICSSSRARTTVTLISASIVSNTSYLIIDWQKLTNRWHRLSPVVWRTTLLLYFRCAVYLGGAHLNVSWRQ